MEPYVYNAVALPDANIIEFSVQGPDPKTVYLLANGIGQHAVEYVQSLYQVYDLLLLDPAALPVDPISPQPLRDAGVAFVVGLALGVVLALISRVNPYTHREFHQTARYRSYVASLEPKRL